MPNRKRLDAAIKGLAYRVPRLRGPQYVAHLQPVDQYLVNVLKPHLDAVLEPEPAIAPTTLLEYV